MKTMMPNPKSEIRGAKEIPSAKPEAEHGMHGINSGWGIRVSFGIRNSTLGLLLLLSTLISQPSISHAQNYSIDWFKIAGGGGKSTGGVYVVSGTIGQPDAGGPMTNGPYSLTGGFWALPTLVQTPGGPTLYITNAAPGFATIWWAPPTPGFTLQSTDSLSPTNWVNAPSGTNNPATIPATPPAWFYRLFKP